MQRINIKAGLANILNYNKINIRSMKYLQITLDLTTKRKPRKVNHGLLKKILIPPPSHKCNLEPKKKPKMKQNLVSPKTTVCHTNEQSVYTRV